MAEIHKKGDGAETANGAIPVITPSNIGAGFIWDNGVGKYNVSVGASSLKVGKGLHFLSGDILEVKLSKAGGNLLQLKDCS